MFPMRTRKCVGLSDTHGVGGEASFFPPTQEHGPPLPSLGQDPLPVHTSPSQRLMSNMQCCLEVTDKNIC